MKILWLGRVGDHLRMFTQPYSWQQKLGEKTEIVEYGLGWEHKLDKDTVEKDVCILEKEFDPDLIIIVHFLWWTNLKNRKCPAIVMLGDPHKNPTRAIRFINDEKLDASLHRVRGILPNGKFTYGIERAYRNKVWNGHHLVFFPWSINSNIFKDYKFKRIYDTAMVWNARHSYPIRGDMVQRYKTGELDDLNVFYSPKPVRTRGLKLVNCGKKMIIRENYAEILAQSKTMVFDSGGIFKYPVMKYTEVMGCNTLALADSPADAEELHFIPNENFVEINKVNYIERLRYYLAHDKEREEIAQKGYEIVRKYHTDETRVDEFLTFVREELI